MKLIFLLIAALVLLPVSCSARNSDASKDWNVDVSVYGLAAGMSGDTTVHGVPANVDVPFSKIWWISIQAGYRWFYSDYKTGSGPNLFRYDVWT